LDALPDEAMGEGEDELYDFELEDYDDPDFPDEGDFPEEDAEMDELADENAGEETILADAEPEAEPAAEGATSTEGEKPATENPELK